VSASAKKARSKKFTAQFSSGGAVSLCLGSSDFNHSVDVFGLKLARDQIAVHDDGAGGGHGLGVAVMALRQGRSDVTGEPVLGRNAMARAACCLRNAARPNRSANPRRGVGHQARAAPVAIDRSAGRASRVVRRLSSIRPRQHANARKVGKHDRGRWVIDVSRVVQARRHRMAFAAWNRSAQLVPSFQVRAVSSHGRQRLIATTQHIRRRRRARGIAMAIRAARRAISEIDRSIGVLRREELARRIACLVARRTAVVDVT